MCFLVYTHLMILCTSWCFHPMFFSKSQILHLYLKMHGWKHRLLPSYFVWCLCTKKWFASVEHLLFLCKYLFNAFPPSVFFYAICHISHLYTIQRCIDETQISSIIFCLMFICTNNYLPSTHLSISTQHFFNATSQISHKKACMET